MGRRVWLVIAGIAILLVVVGVYLYFNRDSGVSSTVAFELGREFEISDGIFSGIIFANNRFYVSFGQNQSVYVKEYDANFTFTGLQQRLTGDGVKVADHKMIFADDHFYLVHSIPPANALYLKKFYTSWNEVKSVAVVENASGGENTNDMFLSYAEGSLYVGSTVHTPKGHIRIRKYDSNLKFKEKMDLSDMQAACGSSMFLHDDVFYIASSDRFWNGASLIVLRYDKDWALIDSKTISADKQANERFPMGFLFENGRYFVAYTHQTGDISAPPMGEMPPDYGDLILKVFDSGWNLLGQTKITDDLPANSANRVHLAWANGKIYASYDTSDHEIFVKEYLVKESL